MLVAIMFIFSIASFCLTPVYLLSFSLLVSSFLQDFKHHISPNYRVFIKYCFLAFKKYSELWPFSVYSQCQSVYRQMAGRTPSLQQNWQSFEKSQHLKEKNTIFNTHPVHHITLSAYMVEFSLSNQLIAMPI